MDLVQILALAAFIYIIVQAVKLAEQSYKKASEAKNPFERDQATMEARVIIGFIVFLLLGLALVKQ
ncbi:hypothetical protein E1B22_03800 [Thermaerobacter sp. FW80]|uniref:hypothetical protein n=1 Tax=Thermaerobacter sp. FW80 TaxID=2546351 RepID=UPI001074A61B|nr:hypothetical protein [Thermaerobacter sp. FW80]QBS37121.1 hypothetical protein E1B22_03800 [Thermaerobacter sp. FW80]